MKAIMGKKILKISLAVFFLLQLANSANAQPFANDIAAFKKQDSIAFPPKNAILFVGSSSFTKWKDVQNYFPGYPIINRGFGGSVLNDVIRYEKDIIFPYQPKQIVIYCGENDVASSDTVSGKIVLERFKKLYTDIRQQFPTTSIVFISLKPCPSRWQMKDRMMDANKRIKKYLKKKKNTRFVSVWKAMLDAEGKPIADIFIEDRLHMNAKGYAIWQKILEPYLKK
ncbi:GDSL-type esterase/lipase family protein [Ferruginibacter sp. SUN106]|uniref:GDSL-type esterase/lipase family protein n=1 Tax=Ferruginibacter sp. SUN106 TaxID=2978348 RepID=UPI003D35E356